MDARAEVERLLKEYGGILIRHKKHRIWKLPSGKKWTTPSTPSDTCSWQNNLGELRLMLGLKSSDKTMADFAHQKKEVYVKPAEQKKEFLAHLVGPTELPVLAPVVPFTAAERLLDEQRRKEVETRVFTIGGVAPVRLHKGSGKGSWTRSGKAYTYSPEVKVRASYLLEYQGQEAMNQYLFGIRNGNGKPGKQKEEEKEMGMDAIYDLNNPSAGKVVAGGGIEEQLKEAKERLRTHQAEIQKHTLEAYREEQVIALLENALRLSMAPRQTLKEMVNATGRPEEQTNNGAGGKRKKWRPIIELVVGTSPVSLTKGKLLEELQRTEGAAYQTVYGAVTGGLKRGWLVENRYGFIRTLEQSEKEKT